MSQPSITCPVCGMTSHNPNDVTHGYCGACHDWTGAVKDLVDTMPFDEVTAGMFFDRQGHPISLARYSWLSARVEPDGTLYKRIAADELPDGIWISTVWLGTNTSLFGLPEIFETGLFLDGEYQWNTRYTSEAEARHGHDVLKRSLEQVGRTFLDELLRVDGDDDDD